MKRPATASLALAVLTCATTAAAGPLERPDNPKELGRVRWGRDLDTTLAESADSARPVLLLFQEIPGCQTCVVFGQSPMSDPLLVEAIENEFVPIAVYNNKPGRDEEILKRYEEPAWNYPVMRFLDAEGRDILPRRDQIWSTGAVAKRLVNALEAAGRRPPAYLTLTAAETAAQHTEKATFAMHCFWEGEAQLGSLTGVIRTRAAWVARDEVVEVVFDPAVISYKDIVAEARRFNCADKVYAHDDAQLVIASQVACGDAQLLESPAEDAGTHDQEYALARSGQRYLPLTPMQATKTNADLRRGKDGLRWLSPRQQSLLEAINAALDQDPGALSGLQRPGTIDGLPAYEQRLRARLRTLGLPVSTNR